MYFTHATDVDELIRTNCTRDCLITSSRSYRLSASGTDVISFIFYYIMNYWKINDFIYFFVLYSVSYFLMNYVAILVLIFQTSALLFTLRTLAFDFCDPSLDTWKTIFVLAAIKGSLQSSSCT